jgi:hypothetical protein
MPSPFTVTVSAGVERHAFMITLLMAHLPKTAKDEAADHFSRRMGDADGERGL